MIKIFKYKMTKDKIIRDQKVISLNLSQELYNKIKTKAERSEISTCDLIRYTLVNNA